MNMKNIICENEYIFEEPCADYPADCDDSEIDIFLKSSSKCLVVSADKAAGKSFQVKRAVLNNAERFSRVYYVEYDKEKYLNLKSKSLSIDNVLKKNIIRLFMSKGLCNSLDDIIECFENSLKENTLLVIDNYDIAAFSPYLRHLLKLDCKMIVVTRKDVSTLEKDCSIKRIAVKDDFHINPLCDKLKNRYCEYFNIAEGEFEERLKNTDVSITDSKTDDFLLKLCSLCSFDDEEYELLRTLGAFFCYLSPSTEINSSKNGVFDVNSVKYYLGNLVTKLEKLIFLGLVNVSRKGELYFDRAILEFVTKCLKPDEKNCPTFISYVKKVCDFDIVQSVKDTDGLLYTYEKKEYESVLNQELLDLYTHFINSDKNANKNVYNILICNTLENYNAAGVGGYTNHLLWQNKNAYLSVLCNALNDKEFTAKLYDFDERYNMYPDSYSESVLAKLDILRVAASLLKGVSKQLYFDFEMCFDMIDAALNEILLDVAAMGASIEDRMSLIYDSIRIVYELFGYCSAFDREAFTYNKRKSLSSNTVIMSTSIPEIDNIKAVSINMAYSLKTVHLYGTFQRLLYEYKRSADIVDASRYSTFYKTLLESRKTVVNKAFCDISSEFSRIMRGYDRFFDLFSKENTSIKIWQRDISDDELEEKLNTCKRLCKRGFDGGTKTGAERFAKDVLKTLCDTKNSAFLVSVVLSKDFEISDNTYNILLKNDFASKILVTKNISKTDKALLLQYCIDCLCENEADYAYFELVLSVVIRLATGLELSNSQKECVCERLCFSYLKSLSGENDAPKTKKLFEDYFSFDDMPKDSAVCAFVYAYKCKYENTGCMYSKNEVVEAAKTVAFENMHRESSLDLQGYLKLVKTVCGEKCADEICNDIYMCKELF